MMRTTLDIDDAVLAAARGIARADGSSVGAALSSLARRGLAAHPEPRVENGIPIFDPPADAVPITLEMVNAHRDG